MLSEALSLSLSEALGLCDELTLLLSELLGLCDELTLLEILALPLADIDALSDKDEEGLLLSLALILALSDKEGSIIGISIMLKHIPKDLIIIYTAPSSNVRSTPANSSISVTLYTTVPMSLSIVRLGPTPVPTPGFNVTNIFIF